MEWNGQLLKQLVETDDSVLKKTVESAARAAGAGEKQAQRLTSDMNALRRVIAGMKPSDLNAVIQAVGEENLKEILKGIPHGEEG